MADPKVKYVYSGPPVFVVELQREVSDGDEVKGSPALAHSWGFKRVEAPVSKREKSGE